MPLDPIMLGQAIDRMSQIDAGIDKRVGGKDNATEVAQDMGQLLRNAIAELDASQKTADQGIAALVANEPVDLHQVMLQMEEASLRLNLALQVRNKIVEAYQEIQRMQL